MCFFTLPPSSGFHSNDIATIPEGAFHNNPLLRTMWVHAAPLLHSSVKRLENALWERTKELLAAVVRRTLQWLNVQEMVPFSLCDWSACFGFLLLPALSDIFMTTRCPSWELQPSRICLSCTLCEYHAEHKRFPCALARGPVHVDLPYVKPCALQNVARSRHDARLPHPDVD